MKIDEIRPSFTVYLISPRELDGLTDALAFAGYANESYLNLEPALQNVARNPPHVVVLEVNDESADAVEVSIARLQQQLPESHVILLAPLARRAQLVELLDAGAYDILYTPLAAAGELLKAVDRAVERDYFMYLNERAEAVVSEPSPVPPVNAPPTVPSPMAGEYARAVFRARTVDECVALFLERIGGAAIYLRYIPNRRVLLASAKVGVDLDIGNLGIDLNAGPGGFQSRRLREPRALLLGLIDDVFGTDQFFTRTLEIGDDVQGVFVFLNRADDDPTLNDQMHLVERAIGFLELEKRLHVVNVRDDHTDVLARPHFLTRVTQEVSRARRLSLPASLLILAFDQYDVVGTEVGKDEALLMLRTIARLCERYSRVNDVIGRVGAGELGLLLPHTDRRGALVKAERLRRALAQADFTKVVRTHPRVTVSIGVSEYPTLVRDAEDLLSSADETLFHIRSRGNRVAVAEPPKNFTPDFAVSDKGS